ESVEGKRELHWEMTHGLDCNYLQLGRLLAEVKPQIYQHPDEGLLLVQDGRPKHIASAKELGALLVDALRVTVWRQGRFHGEIPSDGILNKMLSSKTFLQNFRRVEHVLTTPVALGDFTPPRHGFNEAGHVLYLGPEVEIGKGTATIDTFLDAMPFD